MVKQVPLIGLLMLLEGVIECLMGPYLIYDKFRETHFEGWLNVVMDMPLGVAVFLVGVARILAGLKIRQYHSRSFGIVAMYLGLVSIFSCYLLPTSLGVSGFGLVVLLHPDVESAFNMGEEGKSPEEIQASFTVDVSKKEDEVEQFLRKR
jgi:hypothetical protein